jgi:hypothetical protein
MRVWTIAGCAVLGFIGASSANPLDSPGTIYIDGLPCNLPCQSYMALSRQMLKQATSAAKASPRKATEEAPRKHVSKRGMPAVVPSRKKSNDLQATLTVTPKPPPPATFPFSAETRDPQAAPPEPQPLPKAGTETTHLNPETSEVPKERTPQEQVMAALEVAEQITNAETPKTGSNDDADETKSAAVDHVEAAPPKHVGALVALLISRPDVKSASALGGSTIAVDATQAGVGEDIRSALASAGAADIQLSVSDVSPLDRLVSGDVQAAVLKLVSPDAAESFPDIKGFKVLRVTLSP